MKILTVLVLLSTSMLAANIAQAEIQFYAPHADVIWVKSQPDIANYQIYSLAKARDAIDESQARVHKQIRASLANELTQQNERSSLSEAS